jgi:endonuclease G
MPPHPVSLLLALLVPAACDLAPPRAGTSVAHGADSARPRVVFSEIMADPQAVPDEQGEWIELFNASDAPVSLRGWRLESRSDAGHTISRALTAGPGETVVLARNASASANGGVRAAYMYESLSLANGEDWLVLRDARGATVDSVGWRSAPRRGASWALRDLAGNRAEVGGPAWTVSTGTFGRGDRGTPGRAEEPTGTLPRGEAPAAAAEAAPVRAVEPVYRNHLEFGTPRDGTPADDHLMEKPQYALSYNPRRNAANWVAWNLNRTHFGDAPRSPAFTSDPALPSRFARVVSSDYTGSGYTRGHMVRSEERTATPEDNASTFLLTNILPQTQDLNAGPWLGLERHLQEQAQKGGREIYVLAGGIFPEQPETLNGRGRVAIPTHTWKIAVLLPSGQGLADVKSARDLEVIAASMPNVTGIATRSWRDYLTTVDALEEATGYDFLERLPDTLETEVERRR